MQYQIIKNIKCYDADLAVQNDDFESKCFPVYEKYAPTNFWYKYRNELINYFIRKKVPNTSTQSFLEIGCGNGIVSNSIKQQNFAQQDACDIYLDGIIYAKERLKNISVFQYNLFKNNLETKYDNIGCFDVLEHIDDDNTAIKNLNFLLKPNGLAFITVPSKMELWSDNDVVNKHKRRYTKQELKAKFNAAGFEVQYVTYFMFLLYPAMRFVALTSKNKNNKTIDLTKASEEDLSKMLNLKINPLVNSILRFITSVEHLFIKIGTTYPTGSSLFLIAKKIN